MKITPWFTLKHPRCILYDFIESEYVREYVHIKLFFSFFLFNTQIILIVFFSGQINPLYDI